MQDGANMLRTQTTTLVGTSAVQIAGPNPRRWGLIISTPPAQTDPGQSTTTIAGGVDTSTTGVKASFTVPAGQVATLLGATLVETTGTGVVVSVQVVRAAVTLTVGKLTTLGSFVGNIPLVAGDVVQLNVTTAVGASVCDLSLSVASSTATTRVTVSLLEQPTIDNGINLYPTTQPLQLTRDHMGAALHEAVWAIASGGSVQVTVVDLFH